MWYLFGLLLVVCCVLCVVCLGCCLLCVLNVVCGISFEVRRV